MEKITFFGSGPVAAKSLELLAKNFEIEAVITKPKPPHFRGNFPVIDLAEKLSIKVLTVSNKSELDALIDSKPVTSRVGVVIDFGIIVSQKVIDYFPLGIINSHFSLLPEWRGADPITFSILSGQDKTGVSLMVIDAGLDTGKLITYRNIPITSDETTPSLTEKLISLSDDLLAKYLPKYIDGDIQPKNQPHPDHATHSRKLTKEDGVIDWNKSAEEIEREIRAFMEWPKSRTTLFGKDIVITKAHAHGQFETTQDLDIGGVSIQGKTLIVRCGAGYLCIEKLKPASKNEMTSEAFLAGNRNLL